MHPTLLIGPADWDASRWPREEFSARLAALWQDHPEAAGAVVYGNASDHAGLAYLTHFTPKLEAALALIPREGGARLLVAGGANMLNAARPLTFVEDLGLLRGVADAVEWVRALPTGACVLIGGDAMPYDLRCAFAAALGAEARVTNGDDRLRIRMRKKSPRELAALRAACGKLEMSAMALRRVFHSGGGVTACVLAAEHAALHDGAQDVRTLFAPERSLALRPFDLERSGHVDPLLVYIAVRHDGYWAEAFVSLSSRSDAMQAYARKTVDAMVAAACPGSSAADLWRIFEEGRGQFRHHPLACDVFGGSIGLALDEQLPLTREGEEKFTPGDVYSLRAGFIDGNGWGPIASAMLIVTDAGVERIWPPRTAS
jgi:hypothetical protein